jgi:hypothetical protein
MRSQLYAGSGRVAGRPESRRVGTAVHFADQDGPLGRRADPYESLERDDVAFIMAEATRVTTELRRALAEK